LQTVQGEVSQLTLTVPQMDTELKALQNQLYEARQAETFIRENLERWQKNNEDLFRNYVELTNEVSRTAQDIALLEQEVRALSDTANTSKLRADNFQQQYNRGLSVLQVLELRQRAIQRNADLLLQKMQEAQIAVREDVSDVSIAARAVMPARHYFPQRTLFLLLACLATAGVYLGLLARQRYLQLHEV
jgi:chromosome segregation ATPase